MSDFAKTALLLLLAIGVGAALLAVNDTLSFYQSFVYCLTFSLLYGWALYIPFAVGYAALARRRSLTVWSALLVGAGLAVVATAPIWASPTFPAFSGSRPHEALSWAVAGAFYGLVHHFWIARYLKNTPA